MWKPPLNFITLHYAYIITLGILGIVILYPYGNLSAVDAYLFGVSSSTESGLNPVDVKELKTYQQLFLYFVPIVANAGFINLIVVVVRLHWFEKHLKKLAPTLLQSESLRSKDAEAQTSKINADRPPEAKTAHMHSSALYDNLSKLNKEDDRSVSGNDNNGGENPTKHKQIPFTDNSKALHIPSPRERDRGNSWF